MTTETTLNVPDISCGHCKASIEEAVGGLAGVESVNVEIEPRAVHLAYDPASVDLAAITAAIEGAGYEVAETS